ALFSLARCCRLARSAGGRVMSEAVKVSAARSYRACPIGRTRRTKAHISAIRTAILDVVEDDPPMTVRQVFYLLVARGVIEKTEEQYQGTVIRLMTEMRLDGSLPYSL